MSTKKCKLSALVDNLDGPVDVFVCCASYESRCRSVADQIEPESLRHALVVENTNLSHYVGANSKYLCQRFESCLVKVDTDSTAPVKTADSLMAALESVRTKANLHYLVDITTFTHESTLILFRLLSLSPMASAKVTLVYANAADYSVGAAPNDKWLSKGVSDVRSVLGYPGEVLPSRKNHLTVLVGYEYERATKLIEVFEPNLISLGCGSTGTETGEKHRQSNLLFYQLVSRSASKYGNVTQFEFSCNDPLHAAQAILARVKATRDFNQIVAPMNTKLSTIACALAALRDETIQLCYAQALHYNYDNYSSPGESCYLSNLGDLLKDSLAHS